METKDPDLVSKLSSDELAEMNFALNCLSPDDAKYFRETRPVREALSAKAEWEACAYAQYVLIKTRAEFGKAEDWHVKEVEDALKKFNPVNAALIECDKDLRIFHDQLAVIEELGRHISPETKALLHPGTTSYDILDTARAYILKETWRDIVRPVIVDSIESLCDKAERSLDILQVGRTHLKNTSPVPFRATLAIYARKMAERLEKCDEYFDDLKGKISGIVGTGASIDMVIGEGKSLEFERKVLEKLGLKPDETATQITDKGRLADVGHGLTILTLTLVDFAKDIRKMYSSAIGEVVSRDNAERLGGSSADASKDNPINWENIAGKGIVVQSGMPVLYAMMITDFQRDLEGSVQARYQPQPMISQVYESFNRLRKKCLPQLSVNMDKMEENLQSVKDNPSEAMTAILRGEQQWVHPEYGVGHDFVKEMAKRTKKEGIPLLDVALGDNHFKILYDSLPDNKQRILRGELDLYVGHAPERARSNIKYVREYLQKAV